jgi:esterase/lipase superfamily enzyme
MFFEYCYWPDIPGAIRTLETCGGISGFLGSFGSRDKNKDWHSTLNLIAMSACYSPNLEDEHGFDLLFDPYTGEIRTSVWQRWLEADPLRAAPKHQDALRQLRLLYFDCGRRDEYNLHLGARALHRLLEQQSIPHVYEEFDGGHSGINWRYDISLPLLAEVLAIPSS